jgi:hypothetical protein
MAIPFPSHDPSSVFSPLDQLKHALGSGVAVWDKITTSAPPDIGPLLGLTFILEDHIETLLELCMLQNLKSTSCNIIERLKSFYQNDNSSIANYKRGPSLHTVINDSLLQEETRSYPNYYEALADQALPDDELIAQEDKMEVTIDSQCTKTTKSAERSPPQAQAIFPEDLGISAVSSLMTRQQQDHQQKDHFTDMEDEDNQTENTARQEAPPTTTVIPINELVLYRYRLNLIRHKFATSTELKTLQLFKTFATAAMKTDKRLNFLPVDSTKQHLTPITSQKQIENLSDNHLRLYFSSWFKDQHHSISGFIHITTEKKLVELTAELPLAQWLQTYQYSIALCKSQDEELSLIGALCYGSLFIYRDGLMKSIQEHPSWVELNKKQEKPIIFDLIVKPFRSIGKSAEMIFVRAERSKKDIVRDFFLEIYDGTPKKYPRGDMLLFIPVASKLEVDYTDSQRAKFLFNHMTYLGDEDCVAITGLAALETDVTLKDNSVITIRTLLKSLPASPGMSRTRLFQVVDPHPTKDCVLVTFQRNDRPLVEDRQFTLGKEILSHLASGQAATIFRNEFEGIQFVGAYHKNKGKVIRIHNPSKVHQDFVRHTDSLLSSPPKKRPNSEITSRAGTPFQPINVNTMTYSGAVQAQTTHTRSIAVQPDGTTTTTTTQQISQTVMAVMENRFQTIENEQQHMKQRIAGVENKASSIYENIQAMMAHWHIKPVNYKRKPEEDPEIEGGMEDAHRSNTPVQGQGDMCF